MRLAPGSPRLIAVLSSSHETSLALAKPAARRPNQPAVRRKSMRTPPDHAPACRHRHKILPVPGSRSHRQCMRRMARRSLCAPGSTSPFDCGCGIVTEAGNVMMRLLGQTRPNNSARRAPIPSGAARQRKLRAENERGPVDVTSRHSGSTMQNGIAVNRELIARAWSWQRAQGTPTGASACCHL